MGLTGLSGHVLLNLMFLFKDNQSLIIIIAIIIVIITTTKNMPHFLKADEQNSEK